MENLDIYRAGDKAQPEIISKRCGQRVRRRPGEKSHGKGAIKVRGRKG